MDGDSPTFPALPSQPVRVVSWVLAAGRVSAGTSQGSHLETAG